jgi:AraC-like DNA-binding protein
MLDDTQRRALSDARQRLTQFPVDGDRELSIDELATASGLTTSHFIRRFRAVFGETPHQMRIRTRTRWARMQLETTERSVTDLCMDAGGSSLGSFSAGFTRRVGLSPMAYRAAALACEPDIDARRRRLEPGCLDVLTIAWSAATSDSDSEEVRRVPPV